MNKNLKEFLVAGTSLLVMGSVGIGMSNNNHTAHAHVVYEPEGNGSYVAVYNNGHGPAAGYGYGPAPVNKATAKRLNNRYRHHHKRHSHYKRTVHHHYIYLTLADRKYGVRVPIPYRHRGYTYVKSDFKRTNNDNIMDDCHYYYYQVNRHDKPYIGYIYCDYGPNSRHSYIPKPADISAPMYWINNRTGTKYSYIGHKTWHRIN